MSSTRFVRKVYKKVSDVPILFQLSIEIHLGQQAGTKEKMKVVVYTFYHKYYLNQVK